MIVICEECSKKYKFDVNKLPGKMAAATCTACGHVITIHRPVESAVNGVSALPLAAFEEVSAKKR